MQNNTKKTVGRLEFLDYLRGYFIVVIIVDHLWRYPSLFALISGEAKLWMTAAEGFVMISGFLIGYVRGFKGLNMPFKAMAIKLLKRGLILYLAMIVASIVYIALEWSGKVVGMPNTPMPNGPGDWWVAITNLITLTHPHTWVHFLALYAVFLVMAVPAVWLMRKNMAWLLALFSIVLYIIGVANNSEWQVWQVLFFLPSIAGFYFEKLRQWWRKQGRLSQHTLLIILFIYFTVTVLISAAIAFRPGVVERPLFSAIENQFSSTAMLPVRIVNAALWFTALAFIFNKITPWLNKYTRGTLGYIGSHSLQMYLVHGLAICLVNIALPNTNFWLINTAYGLFAIATTYLFIRLPFLRKLIPR